MGRMGFGMISMANSGATLICFILGKGISKNRLYTLED